MAAGCARAAVTLLLPLALADVIFRVPEVMVRHAANTKAVGTVRTNASRNDSDAEAYEGLLEVRYEEYFVEHEISTADARKAAVALDLDKVPETLPGCGTCSKRELQYCETRVLADHCCCERQAFPEPFPWLPHTCYMGPGRCKPLMHDCAKYKRIRDCCCYRKLAERCLMQPDGSLPREPFLDLRYTCYTGNACCTCTPQFCEEHRRIRDCCCLRMLAERWKHILSSSGRTGVSGASLLLLSMLLFVAYL